MRITDLILESQNYLAKGNIEESIQKLNHALIIDPENRDVKRLLIDRYIEIEEIENALEIIEQLLIKEREDIDLLFAKAVCLNDMERFEDSLDLLTQIIDKQRDFHLAYGIRGIVLQELSRSDEALTDLNHAIKHEKSNPLLYTRRALSFIENEDYETALQDLNFALKKDPDLEEARLNRAFVLRMLGKKKQALADIEGVDDQLKLNAEGYLQKGVVYYKNNDFKKALIFHNLAIENDPTIIEAIYSRALVYCQLAEYDKAIVDLDNAMKLTKPHYLDFLLNGYAYIYFKMKKYDKAIEYANKALSENPGFYWANLTMAEVFGEIENTDDFFENLRIAISGGIGVEDIDETIRAKYAKNKEFKRVTRKLKKFGPYG